MKDFKKIKVWQKAHKLTLDTYKETKKYPKDELYGLGSQMRRASRSIATNIAEGCGRNYIGDYIWHVSIASGSCNEMEFFLDLSYDLGYLNKEEHNELYDEQNRICKMLSKLRSSLESIRKNEKNKTAK